MEKNIPLIILISFLLINSVYSKKEKEFTCLTKYLHKLNKDNIGYFGVEFDNCILTQDKYKSLFNYKEVLKKYGIEWEFTALSKADTSKLRAEAVLALILGAFRMDRFNDGVLDDFLKNKCFTKWLKRLKEIDKHK